MKVLVTGSNGFIAKNLIQFLSENTEVEVLKVHRESSEQELKESILAADWIVHLAGMYQNMIKILITRRHNT